jgi:hypothetical protein
MEKQWKATTRHEGITTTALGQTSEPENQQTTAALAYALWQARGCPDGTPDEDWFRAEEALKNRRRSISTAA